MKKLMLPITLIPVCAIAIFPTMTQAAPSCMSIAQCIDLLGNETGCCCPTGTTGPGVKCPDGWYAAINSTTCRRASTTGTDIKGTYTQEYGTCSGTATTIACYTLSQSGADTSGDCMCNVVQ